LLGEFNLEGIAPAMRGSPQIEVTLDIDANGIMHVSAKDKNTGKENKITIKSDSGLSKEEIERMVQEAEVNAESDKKQRDLIETKNSAEMQVHGIRKDLKEFEVESSVKEKIEEAITALETAIASNDKEQIEQKSTELFTAADPLMAAKSKKDETKPKGEEVAAEFTEVN
jgi:molecular chaperone DnaK